MNFSRQARNISVVCLTPLLLLLAATPAAATPNMIRLGYPFCASCHISPQGDGLFTPYGKGIDLAQTLRPEEPRDAELPRNDRFGRMLLYDVLFSLGIDREPAEATEYGFDVELRTAFGAANHRIVYTTSMQSPTLARDRRSGALSVRMSRLYWLYQPKDGLTFVVGRDDLPSGLGLGGANSFYRRVNNPSVSSTPTQAKVFWWNKRWQVATYVYGPDGNETNPQFEARGVGGLVGANVWKDRAVVGLTSRISHADAFDRRNAGLFLRLGLTHNLGILVEHDVTKRVTNRGARFTHLAGHSQVFFVPFDWLQTALAAEHLTTSGAADTYRLTPSAVLRLTGNIKIETKMRDVFAATNTRTFSMEVQVKTQ